MEREHGTLRGAWQHMYRKEWVCFDCAAVKNEYLSRKRFRLGQQHTLPRCYRCGSVFMVAHECTMARS